jgi:hypothetical protein
MALEALEAEWPNYFHITNGDVKGFAFQHDSDVVSY